MTLNDAILAATGGPTVNDGLRAWYLANGAVAGALPDLERQFLQSQGVVGSNQDMWMQLLSGLGYTGTLNDMLYQFWLAGGSIGLSWQQMVDLYFSNGEQGVIYPLNPAEGCVFQDAAGTIPCTDPDQPVGLVLDVSGNGNHASQPTTTKRPMLRQDGDLWYIQGDGIDDFISTANIDFTGTDKMTVWAGVSGSNNTSFVFSTADANVYTGSLEVTSGGWSDEVNTVSLAVNTGTIARYTAAPYDIPQLYPPYTSTWSVDLSEPSIALAVLLEIDGVSHGLTPSDTITPSNFGNYPLHLLSRNGDTLLFSGNLYSLMIRGAETTDLTPGNEYTAQLTGITLP